MKKPNIYKRYRFPSVIIQYAVWLYYRFNLSLRDIEDLLAERGISVSYETIRLWCIKFGPKYANRLRRKHRGYGDAFFIDEVFIRIDGRPHYLWRAVDQDGEVVDASVGGVSQEQLTQENSNGQAEKLWRCTSRINPGYDSRYFPIC